jgi:hypothetical protein
MHTVWVRLLKALATADAIFSREEKNLLDLRFNVEGMHLQLLSGTNK